MASDEDLTAHLCSLEESLLSPDVRRSSAVSDLLADDFVEFGSSGRTFGKTQIVDLLQQEPPTRATATDWTVRRLGKETALVTYRACQYSEPAAHSLRSSIWQFRRGRWQVVFHQGTPIKGN
jgi:hypothetical protein